MTLIKLLLTTTVVWAAAIALAIACSAPLPEITKVTAHSVEPERWYFGYLNSGFESMDMVKYPPVVRGVVSDNWVSVEWPADYPWWVVIPNAGYAVIAGSLEVDPSGHYGHFGMARARVLHARSIVPPWPITLFYWVVVMVGMSILWWCHRFSSKRPDHFSADPEQAEQQQHESGPGGMRPEQ